MESLQKDNDHQVTDARKKFEEAQKAKEDAELKTAEEEAKKKADEAKKAAEEAEKKQLGGIGKEKRNAGLSQNTLKSNSRERKLQMKQEPRNVKSSRNSLRP